MILAKRKAALLALGLWAAGFCMFVTQGFYFGQGGARMFGYYLATSLLGVGLSVAMSQFLGRLRRFRRAPWLILAVFALAGATVHSGIDVLGQILIWPLVAPDVDLTHKMGVVFFATSLQMAPLYAIFIVAAELQRSGEIVATQERALIESQRVAQEAKLTALQYQINPHFLFNALNAITSLVVAGRNAEAERASTLLGDFMRSSLEVDPDELVPLEDEIDSIATYVNIERIRFGSRLSVSFDVAEDLMAVSVPPLLLQPLFENAIKHGLSRTVDPVAIALTVRRDADQARITVANDAHVPVDNAAKGTGTGLKNIRDRLNAIYGERARLETSATDAGFTASILLPAA